MWVKTEDRTDTDSFGNVYVTYVDLTGQCHPISIRYMSHVTGYVEGWYFSFDGSKFYGTYESRDAIEVFIKPMINPYEFPMP